MTELTDFDINKHSKELYESYTKKLGLSEEQKENFSEILDSIESILQKHKIREKAMEWDKEQSKLVDGKVILPNGFEEVLFELLRDNELINVFLPEDIDGMGYGGNLMVGQVSEKLAGYDLSLQMLTLSSLIAMEPMLRNYNEIYEPVIKGFANGTKLGYVAFTEAESGSNLQTIRSTSELVGDEYILNGTKIFVTNGGYSSTGLFLAQNIVEGKKEGTNVFLVDGLEGITTLRLEEKSGIHASPTAQLQYDNVTVPKEYLIGEVGNGYRKVIERLMGMRAAVGFQSTAACKRAYNLSFDYAQNREQFGKPIISFDDIARKLKSMQEQIMRLEDYAFLGSYALDRHNKGWFPNEVGARGKNIAEKTAAKLMPYTVRHGIAHYYVSSVKLYCSEITNYLLYDAQQIFGGNGFVSEYEVNKICRDVRVLPIYDGTSEIHHWIINRAENAIKLIPRFTRPYSKYDNQTVYEKMLFARYPGLEEKI